MNLMFYAFLLPQTAKKKKKKAGALQREEYL